MARPYTLRGPALRAFPDLYGGVMALRPGDPLPDVALRDAAGGTVPLGGFGGEHTLLIFLRHLA